MEDARTILPHLNHVPPQGLDIFDESALKVHHDEKVPYDTDSKSAVDHRIDVVSDEPFIYDIKSGLPLPDLGVAMPTETQVLTIRAVVVGCMLGSVVQASNLYLGLKTGFTFGPQLFGAIFGFVIIKALSKVAPPFLGGGYFGEKENAIVQTAATSAGGLGILFVSGIPAMYQLNLLGKTPQDDIGRLFAFTFGVAFFGMFFALPLRRFYILKQKLVFPTPTATALTIRALHSPGGEMVAKLKSRALMYSFVAAIILRVVSQYAPGILWDWHVFWWIASWGGRSVLDADSWGFFWEWTPAFLGAGILTGVNASLSLYFGGVFFYGFMGPLLIRTGTCVGRDLKADYNGWDVLNFTKMKFADPKGVVSPRYWLLWAGIFVMLVGSFAEVFCNSRSAINGIRDVYREAHNSFSSRRGRPAKYIIEVSLDDPSPPEEQVPVWAWVLGLVLASVITVTIMATQFDINAGISILAILLGFIFSFIGVQCAGDTDINPISTCAKATQLVVGGATHGKYEIVVDPTTQVATHVGALRVNLLSALVSGAAAAQATDMVGDLKTGHLLRTPPKDMAIAQMFGALCSVFLSVGLFVLFTKAYPCITNADALTCAFGIPSVTSWAAVASATTSTNGLPFPTSAGIFALCLSIVGLAIVLAKNFLVPEHKRHLVPNVVSFGLGAILPPGQMQYGLCMAVASVACYYWKKKNLHQYDLYCFPIAAGLIAGEGLGGVVNALFTVLKIDGSIYGSGLGCPGNVYCG